MSFKLFDLQEKVNELRRLNTQPVCEVEKVDEMKEKISYLEEQNFLLEKEKDQLW